MAEVSSSRSRFSVGATVALVALALMGGCALSPFAYLAYERHRIDRFCTSVVKGEPLGDVTRRARDQGLSVFDPQALEPGFNGEVIVSTNFLLAHLLCSVKHDGQHVESARRSELW
jgi:hypothetical protein